MLTRRVKHLGVAARILIVTSLVMGMTVLFSSTAQASCRWITVDVNGKEVKKYECSTPGNEETTPPSGGGEPAGPTCDLSQGLFKEFCEGTSACWKNDVAAVQDPPDLEGTEPPDEDSHVTYKRCLRTDGSTYEKYYWSSENDGVTLEELALRAMGEVELPTYSPVFNPPTRTVVNLPTWWWADGATDAELVGTAALGVRAIATPHHMQVDPGDGSDSITCAFSTVKSDECAYTYRRASNRGGTSAYTARMRLVWDLRFEQDGDQIEVDGAPGTIASEWASTAIPVREIQTVVVPRNR